MHVGLPDESTLPNGQKFDLLSLALLGVPQCADMLHRVTARLGELKVDANDYICLKFLLLLNPGMSGAVGRGSSMALKTQSSGVIVPESSLWCNTFTFRFSHSVIETSDPSTVGSYLVLGIFPRLLLLNPFFVSFCLTY